MLEKISKKLLGAAAVTVALTACGGGGSSDVEESVGEPLTGAAIDNSTDTGIDQSSGGESESFDQNAESENEVVTTSEPEENSERAEVNETDRTEPVAVAPDVEEVEAKESVDESVTEVSDGAGADNSGADSSISDSAEAFKTDQQIDPNADVETVVTPSATDPFSKFQLDDALYTNNVYDGRQLDATNNWSLIFYEGEQDFVRWEVPALLGDFADPCSSPQSAESVSLSYRLTSRKDSPSERNTFVRAYPAMVVGSMGGRYESWGVECGALPTILPSVMRHGGSPVYQMETVAEVTGLPVLAGDLDYDIMVSVKADINEGSASNGIANIFLDSYWHNVSDVSILPGASTELVNTINGISSDFTEVWNLNIWFDYPRFEGRASSWTGGFKIGELSLDVGGDFDVYFKIEGSRDGHRPRCRLGTEENCFLYIGLVSTDDSAARDGTTVSYTEIAKWMRSPEFRDLFLAGALETDTPAARAHEAWRLIDGEANDKNPDTAKRGPRFPDENHVIGGIHLGSELWYNPEAEGATIVFDSLGVEVEGKGQFGRYVRY